MAMKSLDDLFHHMLQDIYFAESELVKAIPKMAEKTSNAQLKEAFTHHLAETKDQVKNLKKVFDLIGSKPELEECEAIEGLIKESTEIMDDAANAAVRDAGLLAAAQAVEHYEIARYGTLVTWAEQLGHSDAVRLLQDNLAQEKHADQHLNYLALHQVNAKMKAA